MKSWFITYKRPMAPPGVISQIVTENQGCLLTITGPIVGVDLPDAVEIGTYQRPCSTQESESLKALADLAIEEATTMKKPAVPRGTRFLTFGIGEIGSDVDNLASYPMSMPFPAAIKQFDDAMISTARKSLEKPVATLKGSASLKSPTLLPTQDLELSVILRNSGTARILVHNPAAVEEDEKIGLEITLKENLPTKNFEEEDLKFIRLKMGEVTQLSALSLEPAKKLEPLVQLDPGQEIGLSLKIKRHVYFGPGNYKVWVKYESLTDTVPEEEAVHGNLSIPAGSFSVKAKH